MAAVEIKGLQDFRRDLRALDRKLPNEVRKLHRKVSDHVADKARRGAAAGDAQSRKAVGAIKARATQRAAYIETVPKPAFALGVFWGMKRRTGWYANPRYEGSNARQFQPWVGNQWDPGDAGGKPYFIGEAINQSIDEVQDIYLEGIDDLAKHAFPTH